jgi:hypothetical protein
MNIQAQKEEAHCRSILRIDGNIEKSTNAQENVRSLNSRPIKEIDGVDRLIQRTSVI